MDIINTYEAKTHLSELIKRAVAGEEIVIAQAGKPMVKLVPIKEEKKPRQFGTLRGQIWVSDDFDEPMPEFEALFYADPDWEEEE